MIQTVGGQIIISMSVSDIKLHWKIAHMLKLWIGYYGIVQGVFFSFSRHRSVRNFFCLNLVTNIAKIVKWKSN